MKPTLSPIQQERLRDLIQLSNHGGRDQWHGLRCHHIDNGQFTATYGDLANRWGVSRSVVYSTIKRFIKLGLISAEKFERATLFTIIDAPQQENCSVATRRDCNDESLLEINSPSPLINRSSHPKKSRRRKKRKSRRRR